ncbi:MAG: pilus assembly PilX N-terminal domain-containing protein [Burkholderiaceae bacterium]|nr:pilus assembly PilX N-terminal domain-containing protein [Burkholderiaceae bacterium]
MHRPRRLSSNAQRGAAALVVVMILFFIISLVAAYASRNLIFEQRTSANNYRSTQAFDAAEAGLEWAIAMLNGGRIDSACVSSDDPADSSFRDRYLRIVDDAGRLDARRWMNGGTEASLLPSCVRDGGGWSCSCPVSGNPVLAAPAATAGTPAFRVEFSAVAGRPHLVRVFVRGCSNWGTPCIAGATNRTEASAEVNAIVGLAPALTQTPVAAITVRGPLSATDAVFASPERVGLAVNVGLDAPLQPLQLVGPPGMPVSHADSVLVRRFDNSLWGLPSAGTLSKGEMMFLAGFGMPPAAFRVQAAVRRIVCGDDCTIALQDAAARFPGRVLWIDGDLRLGAGSVLDLGSAAQPVLMVVDGNVEVAAGASVVLRGLLWMRGRTWSSAGAAATVIGSAVAEGDAAIGSPDEGRFTITGNPRFVFDAATMEHLKKVQARTVFDFASFTRLPGSWRDF